MPWMPVFSNKKTDTKSMSGWHLDLPLREVTSMESDKIFFRANYMKKAGSFLAELVFHKRAKSENVFSLYDKKCTRSINEMKKDQK